MDNSRLVVPIYIWDNLSEYKGLKAHSDVFSGARGLNFNLESSSASILCSYEQ